MVIKSDKGYQAVPMRGPLYGIPSPTFKTMEEAKKREIEMEKSDGSKGKGRIRR